MFFNSADIFVACFLSMLPNKRADSFLEDVDFLS
jgi:hypothetical protein